VIVEGPDGREYGTAADIGARLVELGHTNGPGLIRRWKNAGHLTPIGDIDGRPLYAVDDVMRVELATRKAARHHGGRPRLTTVG
jgi:hypothetical protein